MSITIRWEDYEHDAEDDAELCDLADRVFEAAGVEHRALVAITVDGGTSTITHYELVDAVEEQADGSMRTVQRIALDANGARVILTTTAVV